MNSNRSYFGTQITEINNIFLANSLVPIARSIINNPSNQTNVWGYKCTYGTVIENTKELVQFNSWALAQGSMFLDSLGYDVNQIDLNLEVFISELFEGESHPRHTHPNSKVSGILYLDTPPGSAEIRFHDPRPVRDFVSLPKKDDTDYEHIDLKAKAGTCYLWPAWLGHEVLTNHSGNKGRLSIVFNM